MKLALTQQDRETLSFIKVVAVTLIVAASLAEAHTYLAKRAQTALPDIQTVQTHTSLTQQLQTQPEPSQESEKDETSELYKMSKGIPPSTL